MKKKKNKVECPVIGIDLGTTNICVARMVGGQPQIVEDGMSRTTRSANAYSTDSEGKVEKFFGQKALSMASTHPFCAYVKLLTGRDYKEAEEIFNAGPGKFGCKIRKGKNDSVEIVAGEGAKQIITTPVEAQASQLSYVVHNAAVKYDAEVAGVVITVPAHFDDRQRHAVEDAAKIANLKVLRIINEPTAAVLAYAFKNPNVTQEQKIVVYDFGGGTFDVTVVSYLDGVVEVKSTAGDLALGGGDIDTAILKFMQNKYNLPESFILNKFNFLQMMDACENVKKDLAVNKESQRSFVGMENGQAKLITLTLNQAEYEKIAMPFVRRTIDSVKEAIDSAHKKDDAFTANSINMVYLVGGSSRIPFVKREIEKVFPNAKIDCSGNPDEVVAEGAARQADILGAKEVGVEVDNAAGSNIVLLDVTPISLGIETQGGVMTPIVVANTTIPVQKTQVFTTAANNQTSVTIKVYQGERTMVSDNKLLAQFELNGIPPAPAGVPQIEVTFDIDANGVLVVTAVDKASGKKFTVKVEVKGAASAEEIKRMKEDAEKYKEDDKRRLEIVTKKNDCERLVISVENTLQENKGKISEELETSAKKEIENLRTAIGNSDMDSMSAGEQSLTKVSNQIYELLARSNNASGSSDSGQTGQANGAQPEEQAQSA